MVNRAVLIRHLLTISQHCSHEMNNMKTHHFFLISCIIFLWIGLKHNCFNIYTRQICITNCLIWAYGGRGGGGKFLILDPCLLGNSCWSSKMFNPKSTLIIVIKVVENVFQNSTFMAKMLFIRNYLTQICPTERNALARDCICDFFASTAFTGKTGNTKLKQRGCDKSY